MQSRKIAAKWLAVIMLQCNIGEKRPQPDLTRHLARVRGSGKQRQKKTSLAGADAIRRTGQGHAVGGAQTQRALEKGSRESETGAIAAWTEAQAAT